jgi:anti-sigma B factor antagonist
MQHVQEDSMPDIQVEVSYVGDGKNIAVISASGFIDTTTAPELEKKLEEQLALNKYKIIVNLENIDYVSSAGWGVFVSEIREIRENNGDLVLVNMSPDVYDVYELMEFSSILKSFDSLNEAVASFSGAAPGGGRYPYTSCSRKDSNSRDCQKRNRRNYRQRTGHILLRQYRAREEDTQHNYR